MNLEITKCTYFMKLLILAVYVCCSCPICQAAEETQFVGGETDRYLIVIAASLRELTKAADNDVGVNPVPILGATATYNTGLQDSGDHINNNTATVTGTWSDMAALTDELNKSKVLVSSEVYTPNGIKAQIANTKSVPAFSADSNGNVQTQYQNLETSISVVPTIIKCNPEKPEQSLVQVDVDVKVSVISEMLIHKNYSAPVYSVKTLTTTRMLTANNQTNVVGTFVTDTDVKTVTRVPILGELPLLKYLFSKEHKEKERCTAVLTLSVRLLPIPSLQE